MSLPGLTETWLLRSLGVHLQATLEYLGLAPSSSSCLQPPINLDLARQLWWLKDFPAIYMKNLDSVQANIGIWRMNQ